MRALNWSVLACALVVSPPAFAQQTIPSCATIDKVAAAVGGNFEAVKGKVVDDEDPSVRTYLGSVHLAGAQRCEVVFIDNEGGYECKYRFADKQTAVNQASLISRWIYSCGGVRDRWALEKSYKGGQGFTLSVMPVGSGDLSVSIRGVTK
jgi:hypothetical protein